MEINFTHDTDVSSKVVLSLEDNLDDGLIPQYEHYKWLCQNVSQDILDNFLGWFGQECIERYINQKKKSVDE